MGPDIGVGSLEPLGHGCDTSDGHATEEAGPCDSSDGSTRQSSRSLAVCAARLRRSPSGPCFGTVPDTVRSNALRLSSGAPAWRAAESIR